jgi:hypothetical protein
MVGVLGAFSRWLLSGPHGWRGPIQADARKEARCVAPLTSGVHDGACTPGPRAILVCHGLLPPSARLARIGGLTDGVRSPR